MGEKKKIASSEKSVMGEGTKKKIVAICLDPDIHDWLKEWSGRRDRSVSWAINYFCKERRNAEWAEKGFVKDKILKGKK
jgi:hypothetical protein